MNSPSANHSDIALRLLKKHWGYDSFRPLQADIVASVMAGRDTLGLMPTGGGKSITFQVPALAFDGVTLVVTPLISLMKDQVDNLRAAGVRALYFYNGMSRAEQRLAVDRMVLGKVKLVYVSPEKLKTRSFLDSLRQADISLIVVDEAHCISQWGYDFRPSYLEIAAVRKLFPDAPLLALTATATPEVVDDIMARLEFRGRNVFSMSFARDNLSYIVRYAEVKEQKLLQILQNTSGCSIVYTRSRRRTREIADLLRAAGISADFYHAGLDPDQKAERQTRWKNNEVRVMVATNAFGMGIDKPDVRLVVHYDIPPSIEEYYQEAGRAGRDGRPAFAVVIAARTDKGLLTRRLAEAFPPKDYIRRVYELAGNFLNVAVGSGFEKLYAFDFAKFCMLFNLREAPTRSALTLLTRAGYIEYSDETETRSRVMVTLDKQELYDLRLDAVSDRVLQMLLRTYTGLFSDFQYISEPMLSRTLMIDQQQVYEALLTLSRERAIVYVPRRSTPYILYTTSRELPRYVELPLAVYEHQRARMEARIEAVKRYVFSRTDCRQAVMLEYFGQKEAEDCGRCDVCRSRAVSARPVSEIEDKIIEMVGVQRSMPASVICRWTGGDADEVMAVIRSLADRGRLRLSGVMVSAAD